MGKARHINLTSKIHATSNSQSTNGEICISRYGRFTMFIQICEDFFDDIMTFGNATMEWPYIDWVLAFSSIADGFGRLKQCSLNMGKEHDKGELECSSNLSAMNLVILVSPVRFRRMSALVVW